MMLAFIIIMPIANWLAYRDQARLWRELEDDNSIREE